MRKQKRSAVFAAAAVLGIVLILALGAVSASASVTMKTTKAVNLRTGPSSSAAKIIKIPKGATVTAGVSEGKWTKVVYRGSKAYGGWAYSKYLKASGSGSSSSSSSGKTKTTATAIWLRTGPGTNYGKIRAIEGGEKVTVLGTSGSWYRVSYKGATGYLKQGYFTDETMVREVSTAIYMRTSPTKSASVILVVPAYGKVTVHSRTSNNWYRVTYNGRSGYIYGGYFTTDSGSSANTRIVKTAIYLRSSTAISSRANIIATIQAGEEVTILSQANSKWYIVRYGSKTGYLRAGYFA